MAFSTGKTIGAVLGAACLASIAVPASAGLLSVAPLKDVGLTAPVTDVASRARHGRSVRHVTVRRHVVGPRRYVGHRRYYYRRHNSAFPLAALGLFAGALGAAVASSSFDDCSYGYGCGYYPSYSYGYGYPAYSYGYAQPRYYNGGRRFHGGYVGQRFNAPHAGGVRGAMVYGHGGGGGGIMRAGGGGHGGGGRGGGSGHHR